MTRTLIITNTADVAPMQVLGDTFSILAENYQTGSYEVCVLNATNSVISAPHSHPWDEALYVIDGAIDLNCEGLETTATAGGFVHIPADMVHSIYLASPSAQVLCISTGKSLTKILKALDRKCGDSIQVEEACKVLESNGVSMHMQPAKHAPGSGCTLDDLRLACGGDTRQMNWSF